LRVVPFNDLAAEAWDEVWARSSDAWLFHASAWIQTEANAFWSENLSFAIEERTGLAAILPLYSGIIGEDLVILSGLHRHAGLAVHPDFAGQRRAIEGVVMDRVRQLGSVRQVQRIHLSVQNLAPRSLSVDRDHIPFWVMDYGFNLGLACAPAGFEIAPGRSNVFADLVVDLRPALGVLRAGFTSACRRALAQAETHSLNFAASVGFGATAEFHELAKRSAQRTEEQLPQDTYYRDLQSLADAGHLAVCHVSLDGEITAAAMVLFDKGCASYLAGASLAQFHHLRVNDFLQWRTMAWLKEAGIDFYRLGPTFPEVPIDWPINRVAAFKRRFGGRPIPVIQGYEILQA
jgi:hypothetical protein